MEKVTTKNKMANSTMVISYMTNIAAKESIFGLLMVKDTKENGKMDRCLDTEK